MILGRQVSPGQFRRGVTEPLASMSARPATCGPRAPPRCGCMPRVREMEALRAVGDQRRESRAELHRADVELTKRRNELHRGHTILAGERLHFLDQLFVGQVRERMGVLPHDLVVARQLLPSDDSLRRDFHRCSQPSPTDAGCGRSMGIVARSGGNLSDAIARFGVFLEIAVNIYFLVRQAFLHDQLGSNRVPRSPRMFQNLSGAARLGLE